MSVLMIQIADKDSIPPEAMQMMMEAFNKNAVTGHYPKLICKDVKGVYREVSYVAAIGLNEAGCPCVGFKIKASMQLNELTGEIFSVTLEESE